MDFHLHPLGTISLKDGRYRLLLDRGFAQALLGLEGFSHLQVLWWFDGCDTQQARAQRVENRPYARGPERIGVFATRSPNRPNPIALSCAAIVRVDPENGIVELDYLDARDGSPLLDLKPYTPSLDRVENPAVPAWCAHWPKSMEASGAFDWESEFRS